MGGNKSAIDFMKKITLTNRRGLKIVGNLEMPQGEIKGTCIVQHGYSSNKESGSIQKPREAFLDNGFITFNFDTTNSYGESGGDFQNSTLGSHTEDLEDVAKWVQEQDWFQKPLALAGHSMGGYAVAKYAEDHPEDVDILVPLAPVVSGIHSHETHEENDPGSLEEWRQKGYKEKPGNKPGEIKSMPWTMMEERLNHDLLPNAKNITMPTLIVVGSEDRSCREQDVRLLYEALPENEKNQYSVIEGAPHSYKTKEHQKQLYNFVDAWLKNVIR